MKKFLLSILLLLIYSNLSYSQNGWQWICPFPQGNTLNQVQFVDPQYGYAVGKFGTIMRTKNGGLIWGREYCSTERTLYSVSFTNIYTGFAVGGDYAIGYVIIKTTNAGVNWSLLDSGISTILYKVHTVTPQIVYCAGTDGKILSTTDGGLNWSTQVSGTTTPLNSIRFLNSDTGIAVGFDATVIRTTNGGQNWFPQPVGFNFGDLKDVQYLDNSNVIAVGQIGRITRSTNGGINWSTQSLDSLVTFNSLSVTNSSVLAVAGYKYPYFSNPVIYTSTDKGASWQRKLNSTDIIYDQLLTVSNIDENKLIAFGIAAYTYKSSNSGNNWYTASNHLTFRPFNSIYMGQNNIGYAIGGDDYFYSVFFKTTDGGSNWFELPISSIGGIRQAQFINDNIIYASGHDGLVIKTTNGGVNWTQLHSGSGAALDGMYFINENTGWIVGGYSTSIDLFKTTNGGTNWLEIDCGISHWMNDVCFTNNDTGLICGPGGDIIRTTNSGLNWTLLSSPTAVNLSKITFVNSQTGFISGQSGVILKTTNCGNNWYQLYTGVEHSITSLRFFDSSTGIAVGGTLPAPYYENSIILKTTNGGSNWLSLFHDKTLRLTDVWFVDENEIFVCGNYGTILHSTCGGIAFIKKELSETPVFFLLSQNYPNPFNPITKIKFSLPSVGQRHAFDLRLVVYDILGREIFTLVNEQLKPGTYEVEWDGSNYPSGVYFYKLTTADYSETRKMVLVK